MASATVKIDAATYAKLRETAAEMGKPMIEVLAKAVETYRRQTFLEALNGDFAPCELIPRRGRRSRRSGRRGTMRWPTAWRTIDRAQAPPR